MLFKIALRNLWRHKRRTLITSAAIALGLGMLMFSSGGTDGFTNNMIDNGVGANAGHVVVQGVGYREEPEVEIVVPDATAVAAELGELLPEAVIVQRIFLDGLLTSPSGAMGVSVFAVQPEVETLINPIGDLIVEGTWLDGTDSGGAATGIVLGQTLAETLDVGLGDKVVLMAQGTGDVESRLFRVQGLFSMGVDAMDGYMAYIPLKPAQELLGVGDGVTQVSAHLSSHRDADDAVAAARASLAGRDLDVLSWSEAMPELAEYVAAEQGEIYVMYFIIFVMVALGIVNTVLMSVLERMREFGVMLSLGTTPWQLAKLVLGEAVLLGLFAALAGVGVGLGMSYPLMVNGLDMSSLYGGNIEVAGVAFDAVIYSDLSPVKTTIFAIFVWCMTIAAAIYPAYKAATLKPVECLQHH